MHQKQKDSKTYTTSRESFPPMHVPNKERWHTLSLKRATRATVMYTV